MERDFFNGALRFAPLYQKRVWGGRAFESVLGRTLGGTEPVGESWELVDRPEAQSVAVGGGWAGTTLNWLWNHHRAALFGGSAPATARFPLLLKLLDAREKLSVQVHPSVRESALGFGEPKTEWWYVLEALPGAAVYAGFRHGVTRQIVEEAVESGGLEPLLHRIPVSRGDSIFVPGGRIHAIDGGCLIAEVQQNSDTTFRVFDWNRRGMDGSLRELHVDQSLACISFEDVAPSVDADLLRNGFSCEFFSVSALPLADPVAAGTMAGAVFLVADGSVKVAGEPFVRGDWFLLPSLAASSCVEPGPGGGLLLRVELPRQAQ
jgi:mannose-6-phosphate isomerase